MAKVGAKTSAPAKKAVAKKTAVKKVAAKKKPTSTKGAKSGPISMATPMSDLTLQQLYDMGVLGTETSKIPPAFTPAVRLSDEDIQRIAQALQPPP